MAARERAILTRNCSPVESAWYGRSQAGGLEKPTLDKSATISLIPSVGGKASTIARSIGHFGSGGQSKHSRAKVLLPQPDGPTISPMFQGRSSIGSDTFQRRSLRWAGGTSNRPSSCLTRGVRSIGTLLRQSMLGIPIAPNHEYVGGFFDLLRPYALLVGTLNVSLFALHGAIYLNMKTEGELQQRVRQWMWHAFGIFLTLYLFTTIVTLVRVPRAISNFEQMPWLWALVAFNVLALANIPRSLFLRRPRQAFISSAATIAALIALFGAALYPNLIVSSLDPSSSLTVLNASSSEKTLRIMAIIAACGMPFVLSYTAVIYWVFRGKVELGKFSY